MKVQCIIEMFESMAASASVDLTNFSVKSPEHDNVHGLVTYYDRLAEAEEAVVSKLVRRVRNESVMIKCELQLEEVKQEQKKHKEEEKQQEDSQPSIQKLRKASAVTTPPSSVVLNLVSKIPQPKSRELHLAVCSRRKYVSKDASSSRTSSDSMQSFYVPPPTPISVRARAPVASYAAFVARIENSQSRLLDFEKDERWLEKLETMKGRVEALKRRNHIALAKEVASIPRKRRSLSECSGESTASTVSVSSMDMLEVMCQ
ncbi:unnamed protein product [Peronospora destructor]|uniref:Uncharacterized protein n=1 Tax=Peronospora destructor TaxID=86335 RepID=A0AAV0V5Q5_9STRA|nr:unnamed protein product [Peronospora destructor]